MSIRIPGGVGALLSVVDIIEQEKTINKPMDHSEKQAKATEIVRSHVGYALGAALVPLPGVDLLAVSAVQLNMLRTLAKLYGQNFLDSLGRSVISAVVGSSAARLGASLVKVIPGVGTVIGELSMPILSGASTYALGRVVANHLHKGGTLADLDLRKARQGYEAELENGKKVAEESAQTVKTDRPTEDPTEKLRKMAELHQAGILSDEEFKQVKERLLAQV
ncbi:MAG: DUF697 domain-containing protein [Chitinophagales bacterium]|nr:DUF697 domain-containing protein [Chitinophagales bacterium]